MRQSGRTEQMKKESDRRVEFAWYYSCRLFFYLTWLLSFLLILLTFFGWFYFLFFPAKSSGSDENVQQHTQVLNDSFWNQSKWNDLNENSTFIWIQWHKKKSSSIHKQTAWFGFGLSSRVIDIVHIFQAIIVLFDETNAYFMCVYSTFDEDTLNMFECSP